MKLLLPKTIALLSICFVICTNGETKVIESHKPPAYESNAFAVDLYARLSTPDDNLLFSPSSIHMALAMTYGGARAKTAYEMARVLYFEQDNETIHARFSVLNALLDAIGRRQTVQLLVANSLWPQKKHPFLPQYLDLISKYYGATITPVDYVQSLEASRNKINSWVADKTHKRITALIPRGAIEHDTVMVLCNAVYFKGNWADPFDKEKTRSFPFQLSDGNQTDVPMMCRLGSFGYGETDGIQVLEISYEGNDLSMVVLLPQTPGGLAKIEKRLTVQNLNNWMSYLRQQQVRVFFPKFKMTWGTHDLVAYLKKMGMQEPFLPGQADFSGMDGTKSLSISLVLHKAFIGVDEKGTEAAASTSVGMFRAKMTAPKPVIFRADHPFLFLIRNNETGCILFMGKLMQPITLRK